MDCPLERDYAADLRLRGLAPGSVERGLRELRAMRRLLGVDTLAEVTAQQAQSFVAAAPSQGGMNFRLRAVRPYFRWLVREGVRADDPTKGVVARPSDEPQTTASRDQVTAMLAHAQRSVRDTAVLTILVSTGARRSEVGLLTFGDARLLVDQGMLRISRSKTQARVVPLDSRAERALRKWLRRNTTSRDDENLWLAKNGPQLVGRCVTRHSQGDLSPHALRRAVVGQWLADGGSTVSLGRLMGWSPATTNVMASLYSRAVADDVALAEYRRLRT